MSNYIGPKTVTKHIILAHGMKIELNGLVKPLFFGKFGSLPLMCLKYNESLLKTQSMIQSTICLPRFSNSKPLKCNVHKIIKRSFMSCNMGLKVKEKRWTNILAM